MALGAALLGGVNGFNQGQAISQQRRLNDLTIAQQLAQASQQQQAQLQLDSILEGLSQPLTTPGFNPLAGTPLGNTATPGGNDLGAVLSQVQTAQDQGVQPQLSSIPQALNEISIQDVISQSQQLRTQAQSGIAQLAANPLATPALIREQAELANSRIQEFNQQNLTPLSNSIGVIQQSLLDNDIKSTRAIGEAVVSRAGPQNQQILRQTLGLDGTDEELESNIRLAARAFGVGEQAREREIQARGTGLARQLDTQNLPETVVTQGNQQFIRRGGVIDPSSGVRANNLQAQDNASRIEQAKAANSAAGGNLGITNISPKDFTVDSIGEALETNDITKLKRVDKGANSRANAIIDDGLDAARGLPVVRRSLDLLSEISTGGFAGAAIRAKQAFGIEGADEGELSSNLGKAVLSQLRETFGAQFTEREGKRLERIESGLGKSTATNIRLLGNLETFLESKIDAAKVRAENIEDFDTIADIERFESLDFNPVPQGQPVAPQTNQQGSFTSSGGIQFQVN